MTQSHDSDQDSKGVSHNGAPDRYLLCSGGMDSVALTHKMMDEWRDDDPEKPDWSAWNKRPIVIYLDTGIGLSSQRIYVTALADHYGWQLWCLRTHEDFDSHSEEEGYYGPNQHDKIFNMLKGRQLSKLSTVSGNPHYYFGTRRAESQNRAEIEEFRYDDGKRAWVHNPLYDKSDEWVVEYLQENDVPANPNWWGAYPTDCACGATAAREELLELEAEGYVMFAKKLRDLEERVETGDRRETWAWGSFSEKERSRLDAEADDAQTTLSDLMCGSNCSGKAKALTAAYPDGGQTNGE